jgi:hypothetical protein
MYYYDRTMIIFWVVVSFILFYRFMISFWRMQQPQVGKMVSDRRDDTTRLTLRVDEGTTVTFGSDPDTTARRVRVWVGFGRVNV